MRFHRSVGEQLRAAVNFPSYCSHHKVWHDFWQAGTLASRRREAQSADCVVMSFPSTVPSAWREEKSQHGKRKRWRWKEGRKVQEEEELVKGKLKREWLQEWEEKTRRRRRYEERTRGISGEEDEQNERKIRARKTWDVRVDRDGWQKKDNSGRWR